MPYPWRRHMAKRYTAIYKTQGRRAANIALGDVYDLLRPVNVRLATDDDDIRDAAGAESKRCERLARGGVEPVRQYVLSLGIEPPTVETEGGEVARYLCESWWRRRLRAKHGRDIEAAALRAGIVHKAADIYASNTTVSWRRSQQARNRALLEEVRAVNEDGDSYTLAELAAVSVSNPKLRRAELMTRIRGFEEVAAAADHAAEFYTVTCPARMHAKRTRYGRVIENEKYDGTTPRDAQAYLVKTWARIRAEFARRDIGVYGMRVCEPQHDGTPHWHLLLFMQKTSTKAVRAIIRKHALRVDGNERGAWKHRFDCKALDPKTGGAAGYIAKYIAKNIDGYAIDKDLYGTDAVAAAERVNAWAARWGIRQFQQVGGPSVTVWRELRRIEQAPDGVIEQARYCADQGHWRGYVAAMGGPMIKAADRPVQLYKAAPHDDGILKLNRYGEPAADQIKGVCNGAVVVPTRLHTWTIERGSVQSEIMAAGKNVVAKPGARVGTEILVLGGDRAGRDNRDYPSVSTSPAFAYERSRGWFYFSAPGVARAPWSRVNNCTVGGIDERNNSGTDAGLYRLNPSGRGANSEFADDCTGAGISGVDPSDDWGAWREYAAH